MFCVHFCFVFCFVCFFTFSLLETSHVVHLYIQSMVNSFFQNLVLFHYSTRKGKKGILKNCLFLNPTKDFQSDFNQETEKATPGCFFAFSMIANHLEYFYGLGLPTVCITAETNEFPKTSLCFNSYLGHEKSESFKNKNIMWWLNNCDTASLRKSTVTHKYKSSKAESCSLKTL